MSLAAAAVLLASPPKSRVWILAIALVLFTVLAGVRFAVVSVLSFRGRKPFLGALWASTAFSFFLILVADLQYVTELLK